MAKKKKEVYKKVLSLNPWPINYGMLSSIGLLLVSMIILSLFGVIIDFGVAKRFILLGLYSIFGLIFYFPLKGKEIKLGFIIGFILSMALI